MIKIAIIGLDTSHSIEFPKLMREEAPKNERVAGLKAISCLRFETPYQNKEGLDKRQKQLEEWGVKVTENIDEALAGCDAIMLEINDGSYHLEYFKKVAALGKPVFLDKPLAMSLADGREIIDIMRCHNTRVWSSSSIPFCRPLNKVIAASGSIVRTHVFGVLGRAPAGDSLIWYGVHSFETLRRVMGPGAMKVSALETPQGITAAVEYGDGREGLVELVKDIRSYGGVIYGRVEDRPMAMPFLLDTGDAYRRILKMIKAFFKGGAAAVRMEETFEGLAMMCAARESISSGKPAEVASL